jgi:hypothetical protein
MWKYAAYVEVPFQQFYGGVEESHETVFRNPFSRPTIDPATYRARSRIASHLTMTLSLALLLRVLGM